MVCAESGVCGVNLFTCHEIPRVCYTLLAKGTNKYSTRCRTIQPLAAHQLDCNPVEWSLLLLQHLQRTHCCRQLCRRSKAHPAV